MILKKLYFGIRNVFIFSKCLDYSSEKSYEKAFQHSKSLKFDDLGIDTYITMVLYQGYAALVTQRFLEAKRSFDFFLSNIDSTNRYNQDEINYLKKYAIKSYLIMDDILKDDLELKNKLKSMLDNCTFNFENVSSRLQRTFILF